MIPLGTLVLVHDSKSQKALGHAVERVNGGSQSVGHWGELLQDADNESSVLQQYVASESMDSHAKGRPAPTHAKAKKKGTENKCLEKKGSKSSSEGGDKKQAKCSGRGDNWLCLWSDKNGEDARSGNKCEVQCTDCENMHPKDKIVTCKDGKYDKLPDCLGNHQCPPYGGGWKCKGIPEDRQVNSGQKCEIECLEPGFSPVHAEVTCGEKEVYSPEAACKQGKHCPSSGSSGKDDIGWKCQGQESKGGAELIADGGTCKVTCESKEYTPAEGEVTCKNGKYEKAPMCAKPSEGGGHGGSKSFALRLRCSLPVSLLLFIVLSLTMHNRDFSP